MNRFSEHSQINNHSRTEAHALEPPILYNIEMATIKINKSHQLQADELKQIASNLIEQLADNYGLQHHWQNDQSLQISGKGLKGSLELNESTVDVSLKISPMLSVFKNRIEKEIKSGLDKYLN